MNHHIYVGNRYWQFFEKSFKNNEILTGLVHQMAIFLGTASNWKFTKVHTYSLDLILCFSEFILDKPSPPQGPLEVSDVHKEGCKLKWKRPADDGGVPLEGYLVEKMDEETGAWVPVGKTKEPGIWILSYH